jgi:hypothetical protein
MEETSNTPESQEQKIPPFRGLYRHVKISVKALDWTIAVCVAVILIVFAFELRSPGFTVAFDAKGGSDVVSQQQMYGIGYAFDFMVKPYMRLASVIDDNIPDYVATLGDDLKILVTADLPDGLTMYDVPFTVTVVNVSVKDKEKLYDKSECIMTTDGDYVVLVDSTLLGIGRYMVRVVFEIPDEDYEGGYRKQVVKINPHVVVKG